MLTTDSTDFVDDSLIISALAADCLEASLALMFSYKDSECSLALFALLQCASIYWIIIPWKNQSLHQYYYLSTYIDSHHISIVLYNI